MNHSRASRRQLGEKGNSTIEFALFVMAGLALMLGGADLVNYMRARMQLDQVSSNLAANITTYKQLYAGDFPGLYTLAQQTAGAIDVTSTNGATVFTGITNPNGTPTIAWRQQTGNASYTSALGGVGGTPQNLPDSYAIPAGSSVIAVEVFSAIHPWIYNVGFTKTPGPATLTSISLFQPRAALLSQITAGNRP